MSATAAALVLAFEVSEACFSMQQQREVLLPL
jgi:hypothetical protein